jgi:hypothetical protein
MAEIGKAAYWLNQIAASSNETQISTGVETSNAHAPKEFERLWSGQSEQSELERAQGMNTKLGTIRPIFGPDKHLFFDNRRGSYGAKLDIGDVYEKDVTECPSIKEYIDEQIKTDPSYSMLKSSYPDPLVAPPWMKGHKGYIENERRDLEIKIADHGMPIMSKTEGADFATRTHNEIINFYLRQTSARDLMIREFLKKEESSFTFLNWDTDATPQNAHRKIAKELAKAQVFYLDPMVASMIDSHAEALFAEGMETQEWPMIRSDELAEFDNNVLVVSVGMDEFSHKTWPTVQWFHHGRNNQSPPKDLWENYPDEHLTGGGHRLHSSINGLVNMEAFTDDPSVRRPSPALIAHDFDDWGLADSVTAWNFDEEMWVSGDEAQRDAIKNEDEENLDYKISLIRNNLREQWLKNIRQVQEEVGARVGENFAPPFELLARPTWAVGIDNARVRCSIRALLDYVNRRATNFKEMPEIPIPYRRLKVTKRSTGKFGFDPNSWKPTIKIIDLPRKPYRPAENTASGRRLTCQFIVEKHHRDQFYPKDPVTGEMRPAYLDEDKLVRNPESHKRILVPVHIKGPEDRPFKEFNALVYAVMVLNEEESVV